MRDYADKYPEEDFFVLSVCENGSGIGMDLKIGIDRHRFDAKDTLDEQIITDLSKW